MGGSLSACSNNCHDGHSQSSLYPDHNLDEGDTQELVTEAQPQVLTPDVDPHVDIVADVWPERWGLTLAQFRTLIEHCRQDENWSQETTMRELVSNYVVPLTEGRGVGYALLVNAGAPREVNVVVSNCWLEPAEGLLQALEDSVTSRDVLYIHGLGMYQCEDGCGPSIRQQLGNSVERSPFVRILDVMDRKGIATWGPWLWRRRLWLQTLPSLLIVAALFLESLPIWQLGCVPSQGQCALGEFHWFPTWYLLFSWTWSYVKLEPWAGAVTLFAHVFLTGSTLAWGLLSWRPLYNGRLIVVPNHVCDVFTYQDVAPFVGCCCGEYAQEAELGVCVVKLELYSARARGMPIVLASPWAPSGQVRRPISGACSTKNDTIRAELDMDTLELGAQGPPTGSGGAWSGHHLPKGLAKHPTLAKNSNKRSLSGDSLAEEVEVVEHPVNNQYVEVNAEVTRAMDQVWSASVRQDSLWAVSILMSASCGVRLCIGRDKAALAFFFSLGLGIGFAASFAAGATAARRPPSEAVRLQMGNRASPGRGWCGTGAVLLIAAIISWILFNTTGSNTNMGFCLAGLAVSLFVGAICSSALLPSLKAGVDELKFFLAVGVGIAIMLSLASSPGGPFGEVYPTMVGCGSFFYGLIFGPPIFSVLSANRWGVAVLGSAKSGRFEEREAMVSGQRPLRQARH